MGELEAALRARRDVGGRAFVPYLTGGYPGVDAELLRRMQEAGADAVEIGIPFSDPVMDGGVIQEASRISLEAGTRPFDVLGTISEARLDIPVAVMTYVNPIYRVGVEVFLDQAIQAGVAAVIVPDLPVDEGAELSAACLARQIDDVLLAAPGARPDRLAAIAASAHGFIYCVGTYGVTGARDSLSDVAADLVRSIRPLTDLPLLVGVGIGSPAQAAQACGFADGVIVGSALMSAMAQGGPSQAVALAAGFRIAVPLA
jgi:tryptophan synthase alpha chain